jgi:hypothetical protein
MAYSGVQGIWLYPIRIRQGGGNPFQPNLASLNSPSSMVAELVAG